MSAPPATAAQLPLPGGDASATVKLHPLLCAELIAPPGWFERGEGAMAGLHALGIGVPSDQRVRVPIVAFLIEHPTAGPILIDTGFHRSVLTSARQNLGPLGVLMARELRMEVAQTAARQCASRGVDPRQIRLIAMTHLHFDHASALCDFPEATVLVSDAEWHAARSRLGTLAGYSAAQLDPQLRYRAVDFESSAALADGPFERTLDVFGDGSVTLISTPGHSAGHMSLKLRLREREALIAGDAVYTMATLRDGARPWRSENAARFEQSLSALSAYDREHPESLIIPGHDIVAWEQLASSYE